MLKELIIIFAVNYAGIIISSIFKLPIPGTIIGMILLFLLLQSKLLKLEKIERAASLLLLNITIFFLPPGVRIMDHIHLLHGDFIKAIVLIVCTTFITMAVTGTIVQWMIRLTEKQADKKNPPQTGTVSDERNNHC